MDIEQVKNERTKLAADVSELVNSFQKRTGVSVKSVDLQWLLTDASNAPIRTQVSIRLEL